MEKISTCLWFDTQAEDAVKLYTSLFKNSKTGAIARYQKSGSEVSGQKAGTVMTIEFELEGLEITALNGGPLYKHTQALSFFVRCETEQEIDSLWKTLSSGGTVRMGLDKYPWAQKYGWTADKFGVEWQFILTGQPKSQPNKIAPAFLFVDKLFGRGEEAIKFYTSLFPNSKIESMEKYEDGKSIMFSSFTIAGQELVLMEGPGTHAFTFTDAFSLVVNCDTQAEIDNYWEKLTRGGAEVQCGWLKDKFGVSWQVVPSSLAHVMSDADPAKAERVMKAMLKMKKLDIKTLEQAYVQ